MADVPGVRKPVQSSARFPRATQSLPIGDAAFTITPQLDRQALKRQNARGCQKPSAARRAPLLAIDLARTASTPRPLDGEFVTDQIERTELHHRQVDIRFFQRSDGLYEVEGRLIDRKSQPFRRPLQTVDTPAGEALHDITVRLVLDEDSIVRDASASYSASPFPLCREAAQTLEPLKGLRIGAGWNKRVRELLRGAASCTHIVELLGPMATTVHQGFAPQRVARMAAPGNDEYKSRVDGCYAYGADREIVARIWPHRRKNDGETKP